MTTNKPTFDLEFDLKNQGYKYIIGIDEAGRGPLAGPVVAAAVYIPDGFPTIGINDSKQISSKNRELFYNNVTKGCDYTIVEIDNKMVDAINIREATKLAMQRCIFQMEKADAAIIDGNFVPDQIPIFAKPIIKGDNLSFSIAAASILAKVWRDHIMEALHTFHPVYNWKQNKGYGTLEHREAIKKYGITNYHRKSFGGVKEYVK